MKTTAHQEILVLHILFVHKFLRSKTFVVQAIHESLSQNMDTTEKPGCIYGYHVYCKYGKQLLEKCLHMYVKGSRITHLTGTLWQLKSILW